ncbi:MAG TPA: energy transducer TonB [Puia sp.]|nr:energy transducer TonB [Puia sp.]
MEANKILKSDLLDIIFDHRNKEYGAYQLRKGYNKRLLTALTGVALITGSLFAANYIVSKTGGRPRQLATVVDVQLESVQEEKKTEPLPPPPPPPKAAIQKIETTRFTPPKIVKDNEVKEEEKPPELEKLEQTKIGVVNQEGVRDEGIVTPPVGDAGKGVVQAPSKNHDATDYNQTFTKVEIESEYPGGFAAWLRYLNKNFRYPEDALNNEIQGTVIVQFIVDRDGNVSDVEAISGPESGGLKQEAMRVIRQSGKWTPAIQNGRQVKSYKKQPVVFKLEQQ